MIKIATVQVKEASRVYADFIEKEAFNIPVDPTAILGSLAGGYAASSFRHKYREKKEAEKQKNNKLENGTYEQIETILRDLKIVFTPINVIYSVKGQVFEIIQVDEMNPYMKQAFMQKDANYFRNLLVNKINMELQLAEQAFAKRLLTANGYSGGQVKSATYVNQQEHLLKMGEEEFREIVKKASKDLDKVKLQLQPTFDNIRPFSDSIAFTDERSITKIAGIFNLFNDDYDGDSQEIGFRNLKNAVNVGFLPDRVVYTFNGQMIEQLTLLHMNDEGYEAFRKRDKEFFLKLFNEHMENTIESLKKESSDKSASTPLPSLEDDLDLTEEESEEKVAITLDEIIEDFIEDETPPIEREDISPFSDPDLHPIAYDRILDDRYGNDWPEFELEALLKQIEIDFELRDGIAENPLNKITLLHTVADDNHTLFMAPFTFEKFMRGMNSKAILFEEFQGNIAFEEILFGLEVAKAYEGDEVYLQFHDSIAAYVSEELMRVNIRFVSRQFYDEENPAENDFFRDVNDFLMRKWKERDAQSLFEEEAIDRRYTTSEQIVEIAEDILADYVDFIDMNDPYASLQSVLEDNNLLEPVEEEFKVGVGNMVLDNVVSHIFTGVFLEYKRQELEHILSLLEREGVVRG